MINEMGDDGACLVGYCQQRARVSGIAAASKSLKRVYVLVACGWWWFLDIHDWI
jgi:hypothetical protein